MSTDNKVRAFETGATRSNDAGRYDPEGFLSPIVIERYCQYMNKHRVQPDGSIRDSDNWQKGIPISTYAKGLSRHYLHAWTRHRGFAVQDQGAAADLEEDLCAIIFNVQGWLFELLKNKRRPQPGPVDLGPTERDIFAPGIAPWPPIPHTTLRGGVADCLRVDQQGRIIGFGAADLHPRFGAADSEGGQV